MTRDSRADCAGYTILELMIALFIVSILAVVALPSYHGYKMRTQIAAELPLAAPMKLAITENYLTNMSWFGNNSDAGFLAKETYSTKLLTSIEISNTPVAGAIILTYNSDELPQLGSNNTIIFYPSATKGGVTWACDAGTIVEKYLPPQCR